MLPKIGLMIPLATNHPGNLLITAPSQCNVHPIVYSSLISYKNIVGHQMVELAIS